MGAMDVAQAGRITVAEYRNLPGRPTPMAAVRG